MKNILGDGGTVNQLNLDFYLVFFALGASRSGLKIDMIHKLSLDPILYLDHPLCNKI